MNRIAETCLEFKPPLRYPIALNAQAENEEEAEEAALKSSCCEEDFSVDLLVNDKSYPANLLHRAPGLNLEMLKGLI